MKVKDKSVSVVIPCRNNAQTIGATLDSLVMQKGVESFELIVVDDHSQDNTLEEIEKHDISRLWSVRIMTNESGGLANAYNSGWKNAKYETIVFMHADCYVLKDDALVKVCKYLEQKDVVAVRPLVCLPEDTWENMDFWNRVGKARYAGESSNIFGGKFDGIRRSTLEKIDGFDSKRFYSAAEDTDIVYRLIKINPFFDSDIEVVHKHVFPKKTTWLSILRKQAQLGQGFGALLRKHLLLVFRYPRFFKTTMLHSSKGVLILGLCFPETAIPALVILMLYSLCYSWKAMLSLDLRVVLIPFFDIAQFAVFSLFCMSGFLLGRQKFNYK